MAKSLNFEEILSALVQFDSSEPKGQRNLLQWVEKWAKQHAPQLTCSRQKVSDDQENLVLVVGKPKIGVIVHHDVVPADPAAWKSDPFVLQKVSGQYYGRGVVDNKTHIAAALVALQNATDACVVLTTDEERWLTGIQHFCQQANDLRLALVCEPTMKHMVLSHPGVAVLEVTFTGKSAHASQPEKGDNAIDRAFQLIPLWIKQAQRKDPTAKINVGSISGGERTNVVPEKCTVKIGFRSNQYSLGEWIRDIGELPGVQLVSVIDYPPFRSSFTAFDQAWLQDQLESRTVDFAPFYSEAAFLEQAGIATILWGVGAIDQAHTDNESIPVGETAEAVLAFQKLFGSTYSTKPHATV